MTVNLAIDVSNYTEPISLQQAQDLAALGIKRAIVQAVNENILVHQAQIPNLLAAGIEVQGYVYVWFSAGVQFCVDRINWAVSEFNKYNMTKMVWLDCEQSDGDTPPFDYVHAAVSPQIRASVDAVKAAGYSPGIYTAAWWWIPGASNSPEWSDLPLWNANYDLDPDLDPVNYGGWTVPRMEQYKGSTTLSTVHGDIKMVDLDSYEAQTVDVVALRKKLQEALELLG